MFYFVFDTPLLKRTFHNLYQSKINSSSYRGHFDTKLLKASIKNSYKIYGHDTHELHKLDIIMGTSFFKGHIIEVKDTDSAVWFKMSHEDIANTDKGIRLREIYNFDVEDYADDILKIINITSEYKKLENLMKKIVSHKREFMLFNKISYDKNDTLHDLTDLLAESNTFLKTLSENIQVINGTLHSLSENLEDLEEKVSKAIEDSKIEV